MWLKCSLCSKNCFFYLTLGYFLRTPGNWINSNSRWLEPFFDFHWRFELSGAHYLRALFGPVLCLRLLEKRRHYVIGSSDRVESDRKPTLIRGWPGSKRLYFRKPRYDHQSVGCCLLGDGLRGPYEMVRRYFGSHVCWTALYRLRR